MLAVRAALTLGNLLYDSQVVRLRLRRGLLPIVDRLQVDLPAGVKLEAAPGDPASLTLDGGEGEELVFTGTVGALGQDFSGVHVTCVGGAALLARYRPALALEQVTVGDVVSRLCDQAGISVGAVEAGPTLGLYAACGQSTALDEIPRLARHLGAEVAFDGDGKLQLYTPDGTPPVPDLALRYTREILAVEVARAAPDAATRTLVGEGGTAPGSDGDRWPAVDFWKGAAPAPGPGVRRRAEPELRTQDDARAAGEAWAASQQEVERPVHLRTWLLPRLAPGGRVELHELPSGLGLAACRIRQVVHTLHPVRGAYSEVWAHEDAGGAGGSAGLLASATQALGGML